MNSTLSILESLLARKDSRELKSYLEGLKAAEKGLAFEHFLELLYNGNGFTAVRQGGKGDLGADILLYDSAKEGVYCVIQAKNRSLPLTFDDTVSELNKFETKASIEHGCREFEIVTINGFVAEAAKLKRFRLNLRDWAYVETLIESYDPSNRAQPMVRLLSHNQTTFDSAIASLNSGLRVACVQATGTGKSYIIAKTMNQFPKGKKLVIAPSHHILNQQRSVAPWLNRSTEYVTYAGAKNLQDSELKKLNPALVVLDEFHRAGADAWGSSVNRILEQCPDAKVLGTSATPIRYLDGERDISDELFDEEAVNLSLAEAIQRKILPSPKYVASLYTLNKEADELKEELSRSALSDKEKKQIEEEIEKMRIDWEASSGVPEILKKYLCENPTNKFIVFCKNKKHLDELEDEIRKWIRKTGIFEDRETYRVYSGYNKSDANLKAFLAAKSQSTAHILLAIDMLNEGIHAPDVGAVLLFRPTQSPRIFYQQIGRCLQVGTNSTPIIFDFVNNFQSIRAGDFLNDLQKAGEKERVLREEFNLGTDYLPQIHVRDESQVVLKTFQEIDERLGSWEIQFQKLVRYKEKHGDCLVPLRWKENKKLGTWVMLQRRAKKIGKLDANRVKRLATIGFVWEIIEDGTKLTWEDRFQELASYKEEHGDCLVPHYWKNKQLVTFVTEQRKFNRMSTLDAKKIKRLDELGFAWSPNAQKWKLRLQELKAYKEEHGDCLVSRNHENRKLVSWVSEQRRIRNRGELDAERIEQLDELDFTWYPVDDLSLWEAQFEELKLYQEKHGDCLVPYNWEEKKRLASWVSEQRGYRKKDKLDAERIKRLDELGFDWSPIYGSPQWETQFEKLKHYKDEHGDCLVPYHWKDNRQLAGWVSKQRAHRKKGKLHASRIKRLDELGFDWKPLYGVSQAENRLQELVRYKAKHGDCLVPYNWKENEQLGRWVSKQRADRKKDKLDAERIKQLDKLDFVWDLKQSPPSL